MHSIPCAVNYSPKMNNWQVLFLNICKKPWQNSMSLPKTSTKIIWVTTKNWTLRSTHRQQRPCLQRNGIDGLKFLRIRRTRPKGRSFFSIQIPTAKRPLRMISDITVHVTIFVFILVIIIKMEMMSSIFRLFYHRLPSTTPIRWGGRHPLIFVTFFFLSSTLMRSFSWWTLGFRRGRGRRTSWRGGFPRFWWSVPYWSTGLN